MTLYRRGYEYPTREVHALPFTEDLATVVSAPPGLVAGVWPPRQLLYLGNYLKALGCRTVVWESHYIDRDYIHDMALFYARSLHGYPNHCQRLHFFTAQFDEAGWAQILSKANRGGITAVRNHLNRAYLGFCVIRPLPASPVGRTVIRSYGSKTSYGMRREYSALREYTVHLGPFALLIRGLAFQQQDRGVSACATTALWSALQRVAQLEGLAVPTPAQITEAASRYLLVQGRALPSGGLAIEQLCEATRAAGLDPLVWSWVHPDADLAELFGYAQSGFAPVLVFRTPGGAGHAVCVVGLKLGTPKPQSDPALHFRDAGTALRGAYVHDDRLGPYASVDFYPWTQTQGETAVLRTGLSIRWPGTEIEEEHSLLEGLLVPLPNKVRLPIAEIRQLGFAIAEVVGGLLPSLKRATVLDYRYRLSTDYCRAAVDFRLSAQGIQVLTCGVPLSRYLGLIELRGPKGPLLDLLLDSTEPTAARALACVRRETWPAAQTPALARIASSLGARLIA